MSYNRDYYSYNTGRLSVPSLSGAPWTKRFIIACVVVYVLQLIFAIKSSDDIVANLFAIDPERTFPFQFYRLLTYGFLHSSYDVFHILFNLLSIFFFAPNLERSWGDTKFILFCCVSIVFSGLVCYFIYPVRVIGASGLVYAVLTAYGFLWPRNLVILFVFPMRALTLVLILLGIETFNILRSAMSNADNVAHFGHLGGAFVGFMATVGYAWIRERVIRARTESRMNRQTNDEKYADELFKKIGETGLNSLSSSERRFLDEYSKKKRGY